METVQSPLLRTTGSSLVDQLFTQFADRIRSRLIVSGARLPSVRACSSQYAVSPQTVVAAYEQLIAHGLVEARKQRGFFVRDRYSNNTAEQNTNETMAKAPTKHPALGKRMDASALVRSMFQPDGHLQPGAGVLPKDWLQADFIGASIRRVCQGESLITSSLQYGDPQGDAHLRQLLTKRLADIFIPTKTEHIITTIGASQALDIVSRTLASPGDTVMVEAPGYAVEIDRLQMQGIQILSVPRNSDGPDIEVMKAYCAQHRPKLFISVSVLHNPTSACLAPHIAHQVVQLAHEHGFYVVEDDTYSHLAPAHSIRMCALDGLSRSIYISGYSKILAPNWRIGFIAAPAHLLEALLDTKLLSTLTTPSLLEKALAWCIENGHLRRHTERLCTQLDMARNRSVKLAEQHGFRFAAQPAGLFGWLDAGVDTETLTRLMLDYDVRLAPGSLFYAQRQPTTLMRINFAATQDLKFWQLLRKITSEMVHNKI